MMENNEKKFIPEQVDEQVEQILRPQYQDHQTQKLAIEERIISALQQVYAHEDPRLKSVWTKLADHLSLEDLSEEEKTGQMVSFPLSEQKGLAEMKVPFMHKNHVIRFSHLLVAGLIVFLLISSMIGTIVLTKHTPASIEFDNKGTLYLATTAGLQAISSKDGKVLWTYKPTDPLFLKPLSMATRVEGDQVAVDDYAVYLISDAHRFVYAIDKQHGNKIWSYQFDTVDGFHPVLADHILYVASIYQVNGVDHLQVYGLNSKNGKLLYTYPLSDIWKTKGPYPGQSTFFAQKDKFIVVDQRALEVFDAKSGRPLWHILLSTDHLLVLDIQVVDEVLYVLTESQNVNYISAFNAASGEKIWQSDALRSGLALHFVLVDGTIYLSTHYITNDRVLPYKAGYLVPGPSLFALNAKTGMLKWQKDVGDATCCIQVSGKTLYISIFVPTDMKNGLLGDNDHDEILALNTVDRSITWRYQNTVASKSSCKNCFGKYFVYNNMLFIVTNTQIAALRLSDRSELWHHDGGNVVGVTDPET